ncbi:MAG: NAD(P)(+) transhydrogenase (Re/Si-specific) subunit beta [Nitrospirae bacterium]|nr:NAD(P)(+) transhydrogenase (Re/Si-specific) subunit beta [Candidatus Troglogloeales bacterium]
MIITISYFIASTLFLFGLKDLTHPNTARRGTSLAALGMLIAVFGTLLHHEIVDYKWIIAGLVIGTVIGIPMGLKIPMTKMPERIALSHSFGGLAIALVGVVEYYRHAGVMGKVQIGTIGFEVFLGAVTFTGSLMAFGKLQELLPGRPMTFPKQNIITVGSIVAAILLIFSLIVLPTSYSAFNLLLALSCVLGVLVVLPIGGADMPVVICLLNSYAGLAASASGFALNNMVLIICGALDGGSGFILALLMCKAMNRSFSNVLFGAFGSVAAAPREAATAEKATVRSGTPEEAAKIFKAAKSVIVVPGYGMAVAQAQHTVREMASILEKNGATVKYAIHPVAGRMPGHMNVLLAEADIPYDKLIDIDDINPEFPHTDISLVIGANDVVNPAAKTDTASPIYGMPILDVGSSKLVMVLKRSMNPGFAGIDNALFIGSNTMMIFGDAKQTLLKITAALAAA